MPPGDGGGSLELFAHRIAGDDFEFGSGFEDRNLALFGAEVELAASQDGRSGMVAADASLPDDLAGGGAVAVGDAVGGDGVDVGFGVEEGGDHGDAARLLPGDFTAGAEGANGGLLEAGTGIDESAARDDGRDHAFALAAAGPEERAGERIGSLVRRRRRR